MISTVKDSKNRKTLYFSIGFTVALFLYMFFIFVPNSSCFKLDVGSNSLGLSFSYTKDMVESFFGSRTQDQLLCYSQFLKVWDPIFALITTAMFGSWILYIFKNKRLFLIAPTVLGMIADWSENFIELLMIKTYVNSSLISETLVSLGSGVNSFKLTMSGLTWLIIIIGIILAVKTFFTKPKLN